ncbi:MAG TPA: hypothetical protein VNT77_01430 [Allosphingosinicella sp.]|nr:hypothetical protein [Allosphingosinicella sp.]
MCILVADLPVPAALKSISAKEAFVETNARPAPATVVELRHPEAGVITGIVRSLAADGVMIGFDGSEHAVAFTLAAITADMSRPA